jgi:hypothetical protein
LRLQWSKHAAIMKRTELAMSSCLAAASLSSATAAGGLMLHTKRKLTTLFRDPGSSLALVVKN